MDGWIDGEFGEKYRNTSCSPVIFELKSYKWRNGDFLIVPGDICSSQSTVVMSSNEGSQSIKNVPLKWGNSCDANVSVLVIAGLFSSSFNLTKLLLVWEQCCPTIERNFMSKTWSSKYDVMSKSSGICKCNISIGNIFSDKALANTLQVEERPIVEYALCFA